MGLAHKHWGHFLVDIVQRCWYLIAKGLIREDVSDICYADEINIPEDYILVFSGFGDGINEFTGNYLEFFRLLGIDTARILIVNESTSFDNVIVPNVAICPGEYITSIYKKIFDIVVVHAMYETTNLNPIEKIYFSRAHLRDKKDMGENTIETCFADCGFTVLYPEEMSLTEQIFYWQTSIAIACIGGTIPHNCVFARKDTKLLILNKMSNLYGYQFTMDLVQGCVPIYIDAYYEPFSRYPISVSRGPFWISKTDSLVQFIFDNYGKQIEISNKTVSEWARYLKRCMIASIKFKFRGSKAFLKRIMRRIILN